ncbi:hypothetical protein Clacol_002945 [Clathrus columnatus]|uniref:DUF7702 domain-containing protein n=1 Tax=Clathrus columnatus TaxID=1419009 RepID=A0AAV5A6U1_9AGAM|nr:hypothetical protein Clacol_002945 [Clathrus columnatus]
MRGLWRKSLQQLELENLQTCWNRKPQRSQPQTGRQLGLASSDASQIALKNDFIGVYFSMGLAAAISYNKHQYLLVLAAINHYRSVFMTNKTMTLGPFGDIAIAEIVCYLPIAYISLSVTCKHGFNRKLGWLFLFTFSVFRLVSALLTVVFHAMSHPATGLVVTATVLTSVGLSPLLLATHAFVSGIGSHVSPKLKRPFIIARLLLVIGLIMGAVGGSDQSPLNPQSTRNAGKGLTGTAVVLFIIVYLFLFFIHILFWRERNDIPPNSRKLLLGVSLALPPLGVRLIYSLLQTFGSMNKFSPVVGEWEFFLFMGLIMEYLVVLIYVITGLMISNEVEKDESRPNSTEIPLV